MRKMTIGMFFGLFGLAVGFQSAYASQIPVTVSGNPTSGVACGKAELPPNVKIVRVTITGAHSSPLYRFSTITDGEGSFCVGGIPLNLFCFGHDCNQIRATADTF